MTGRCSQDRGVPCTVPRYDEGGWFWCHACAHCTVPMCHCANVPLCQCANVHSANVPKCTVPRFYLWFHALKAKECACCFLLLTRLTLIDKPARLIIRLLFGFSFYLTERNVYTIVSEYWLWWPVHWMLSFALSCRLTQLPSCSNAPIWFHFGFIAWLKQPAQTLYVFIMKDVFREVWVARDDSVML